MVQNGTCVTVDWFTVDWFTAGQALVIGASDLPAPMVLGIYRRAVEALPLKVLALGSQ